MIRLPRSRTVTGAAHTNWSMFGARGPCLEGADGGGSGAAPPAPAPAGDPPAPPPAPAPASGEVTFTPEQQTLVNKLVGKAREEGRNAAKPTPAPAPPPAPAAPEKVTIESLAAQLAETQLRARFDKRAAKRGLDDDAAEDLFDLYRTQKPTDDEQWFVEREKRLGLKRQSSTPPQPTTPTAPAAPAVPVAPGGAPISDHGSPAPAQPIGWRLELAQNPVGMSRAARDAMDAELGVEKARKQRLEATRRLAGSIAVNVKQ